MIPPRAILAAIDFSNASTTALAVWIVVAGLAVANRGQLSRPSLRKRVA